MPSSADARYLEGERTPMAIQQEVSGSGRRGSTLADLVRNMGYEVMPFKRTEQDVLTYVPKDVPLTVTVTVAKGIDTTLDLAERLHKHGYTVAPHLPARQFVDAKHVEDVVARLKEAGIRRVFCIGGDAPTPAGEFTESYQLLKVLHELGNPFENIGIGGYPEGHALIPQNAIDEALRKKAPMADRILTQICFDANTTATWAKRIASEGVNLPIYVGMPGPVNRQKLIRISAGIGLGQSARFLQKQSNLLWRFLLPGVYNPTKLLKRLAAASAKIGGNIRGLHIFTFNELEGTEKWRQKLLASVAGRDDRS